MYIKFLLVFLASNCEDYQKLLFNVGVVGFVSSINISWWR